MGRARREREESMGEGGRGCGGGRKGGPAKGGGWVMEDEAGRREVEGRLRERGKEGEREGGGDKDMEGGGRRGGVRGVKVGKEGGRVR